MCGILSKTAQKARKLDEEKAQLFLDTYLNTLDNLNLFFLQSDIDNFQMFVPKIGSMTANGDIKFAHQIFDKFMKRLGENFEFANQTLDTETFEFTDDTRYLANRRDADSPKNKAEQQSLWRSRLRFEYLEPVQLEC